MSTPAWVADGGGPDRRKLYDDLAAEPRCWTPQEIAAIPVPQLWALFMTSNGWEAGGSGDVLWKVNEWRAKKGLPPMREV